MNYRRLGRTGFRVSEIGLGGEYLEGKPLSLVKDVVDASLDGGINILDCFMSNPEVRTNLGIALKGRRDKVYIQGHFRSIWQDGQYGRTLDIDVTKHFFKDLLSRFQTDYMDIGMIHMLDNPSDYDAVFNGPILEYAMSLKEKGIIRSIGISTHNPVQALRAASSGIIDVILFSINPAYDLLNENTPRPRKLDGTLFDQLEKIEGINSVREQFYKYAESNSIGITVMKSLGAGALLDEKKSPFGKAMTVSQCVNYALTRPGVASVMLGMESVDQVNSIIGFDKLNDEEKDYSFIFAEEPKFSMNGRCMYCNHCLPCSSHINIAQVNKYLDLAVIDGIASPTLKAHYDSLEHKADECIGCGICESNCPFGVKIVSRMKRAVEMFS